MPAWHFKRSRITTEHNIFLAHCFHFVSYIFRMTSLYEGGYKLQVTRVDHDIAIYHKYTW